MTAREALQAIVDGEAGEHVRYAPVDLVRACALLDEMERRPEPGDGNSIEDFYAALCASVERDTADE